MRVLIPKHGDIILFFERFDMDWTDDMKFHLMTCGSSEAEKRTYKKVIGKSGKTWLYAVQDNPADNIYCSGGKHSQGMAGRTLEFKLEDGDTISIQGPWHTNAGALLADTGIDLSEKHSTFVVVGLEREYPEHGLAPITIKDVQYIDSKWVIGEYERGQKIAQETANRLGKKVILFTRSKGGSSHGPIKPNNTEQRVSC